MSRDMLIKCRYRAFGLHVTVHFKTQQCVEDNINRYVPTRLYFNEDADLVEGRDSPERYPEVDECVKP